MLQVTLRKARQIEKLLNKKFNENVEYNTLISLHEDIDDLPDTMRKALSEFTDDIAMLQEINSAMFSIREAIGNANTQNGINSLIAERAKFLSLLNRLKQFDNLDTMDSELIAERKIKADLNAPANAYSSNREEYLLNKCSDGMLDSINRHIDNLKQDIVRFDDMILGNNVTIKIDLSESVETLLGKLKIPH